MRLAQHREAIARVRRVCREAECFSWTSEKYQDDILSYLFANADLGRGVIEVGCYKGGLSAQLAFACRELRWPLSVIDIEAPFIETARVLLKGLGYGADITFHTGTFEDFARRVTLKHAPLLVVLDGDHRYDAVVKDIKALNLLKMKSYAAAFHDFSLRHPSTGEQVEQAVRDCLGRDVDLLPIGGQIREDSPLSEFPDRAHPSNDGHYWERPGSEGVIVRLP